MKLRITSRGFYDTLTEKVCLLVPGQIVTINAVQFPAPCKSKQGTGKWCSDGKQNDSVFVDDENCEPA